MPTRFQLFLPLLICIAIVTLLSCKSPSDPSPSPSPTYVSPADPADSDPNPDQFGVTIDSQATANTRKLYSWLQGLSGRSGNKVIAAQHIGDDLAEREFDINVRALALETNKWPGMMGVDYFKGVSSYQEHSVDAEGKTKAIIDYWAQGGLATVTIHLLNPWTKGSSRDQDHAGGQYADAYTPGTAAYANLKADFDLLADQFLRLQAEKVTVLFRPFHEMNGTWFWWYAYDTAQFKALWKYWQRYLIDTRGVHNLLYVFSPNAVTPYVEGGSVYPHKPVAYYPGDDSVDLVALDAYNADLMLVPVANYTDLAAAASHKPFGFGELGQDFNYPATNPNWDQRNLINTIRSHFPNAVYWLSWASWSLPETPVNMAIVDLPYATDLMNDPWVLDASEIDAPLFRDAAKAWAAFYDEKPTTYPNRLTLLPTSEDQSQRWEYSFDGTNYAKSMAPFGSPWLTGVPEPARFSFKFEGARNQLWLRKHFDYTPGNGKDLVLRVFQLGNAGQFYLNGQLVLQRERGQTFEPDYVDQRLGAAGLSALKAGDNLLAIHCTQDLAWGDVLVDAGLWVEMP